MANGRRQPAGDAALAGSAGAPALGGTARPQRRAVSESAGSVRSVLLGGDGEHVRYESARRLAFLVQLDQQGGVVQIGARPCRLLFRTGATATFHDPDFLAEHASGDQVLYDMRAAGGITEKVRRRFDETLRVCRQVGWQYQVLTEPSPIRAGNLAFLRPARLSRCHPEPGVFEQLLGVFAAGRPVGQGAAMVNRGHPATVMPFVKHLIWHRRLMVDLDVRLDFAAVAVTDRGEAVPCCG